MRKPYEGFVLVSRYAARKLNSFFQIFRAVKAEHPFTTLYIKEGKTFFYVFCDRYKWINVVFPVARPVVNIPAPLNSITFVPLLKYLVSPLRECFSPSIWGRPLPCELPNSLRPSVPKGRSGQWDLRPDCTEKLSVLS